ncbi:endolytic transglycosylase MltG [Faecalibaculum rodentium]|uniref:endolytic transglycosylase MltG n=1 Tax=Faecalibaculum rodentium TaxID=1702221 RepID=UPI0023F086EF|nr:endolytic transglycosylase MltG [Faecalibaculum rodentium]
MPAKRPRRRKRIHWGRVVLLLVVVLMASAGGWFWYELQPAGGSREAEIEVKDGESLDAVFGSLQSEGIIRNAKVLGLYTKIAGQPSWYAGTYSFNSDMTTDEILQRLDDPEQARASHVSVTIPEGWWAKEIAARLSEQFPYTAQQFLDAWNDQAYIETLASEYPFLNTASLDNPDLRVKLEGYLFPDTYQFSPDSSIDQITRTFLTQFQKVWEENRTGFEASGKSVEEIVTLASIVQFESGSKEDMAKIAGVFENRLNQGMMLQSSVTVCYALYDQFSDPTACETQYDIESPYNTYLIQGLPPGPILNPGREAIEAVLHPEESGYLFFVADIHNVKSNPGQVYYAKRFEEHEQLMRELGLVIE